MIEEILDSWNSLYIEHPALLHKDEVEIIELDNQALFTNLSFKVEEAISIPSRELDAFDFWSAISKKNCDGAILVKQDTDLFDLVLVEMKSSFETEAIYEAKEQIIHSLPKINILLNAIDGYSKIKIRKSYGIVVSLSPTDEKLDWIKGQSMLPRNQWSNNTCGLTLFIDRYMNVNSSKWKMNPTLLPNKFDIYYFDSTDAKMTIELPV